MNKLHDKALELFYEKQYDKAFELFDELNLKYECGYCLLALGKLEEAKKMWECIKTDSPAINWGLSLISLIYLTIPKNLTFFQIRNFLERDLSMLIETNQLRYAENVISAADILCEYNPETYKFIGRVLLNSGYKEQSLEFLKKALDVCYIDSEIHYLLAEYHVSQGSISEAIKTLNKSLAMTPNYFPAKDMLKKLQKVSKD